MFVRPLPLPRFAPVSRWLSVALLVCCAMLASNLPAQQPSAPPVKTPRTILFFGDSLTFGYGLPNPASQSFPALIQRKIDEAGLNYHVINSGVSGNTSTDGLRRIDWLLQRPVDILVLELGANDGLRGVDPAVTAANLQAIIDKTRARNPAVKIVVAGMRMPPNLGADYVARFENTFVTVARDNPNSTLIPFILEGVGGIPQYNQNDQIHPTAAGHQVVAELVWQTLKPLLN